MTNANNDVRELEDLLTELEGQGALPVGPYAEEDDAVTQLMDAPLGDQEWMVQVTPHDRRMMTTEQLTSELATGHLVQRDTLVWRTGMSDWAPISRIEELASPVPPPRPAPMLAERRPLPPPPAPVPPPRLPTGTMVSPGAMPPAGMPPAGMSPAPSSNGAAPSSNGALSNGALSNGALSNGSMRTPVPNAPYGAPQLTPVPDAPPPPALPLLNSAFGSPGVSSATPVPSLPSYAEVPSHSETGSFYVPLPVAAPPPSAPRTSTPRPVAVDFSEVAPARSAPMKILVGSGIAAAAMIIGTVYALSAGGVFEANSEPSREPIAAASKPAASPASQPVPAPKPAEPSAAAKPAAEKPEEKAGGRSDESESKAEPQTQPASAKEEMVAAPEGKAASKQKADDEASSKPAESKAVAADEGSDEEASDTPRSSRAERRMAARLRKRAAAADDGTTPRRSSEPRASAARATKARATAPVSSAAAEADEAPKGADAPGSTFNRQAAKTALDDAAAQARNCRPQGGPTGAGKVQVRYEPTGKVGAVSILTPEFDNNATGSCLVMVFRRANIPAFNGSQPVVMNKNFEIP
jgi:hypothetical protein